MARRNQNSRDREYGEWLEKNLPEVDVVKASQIGCTSQALEEIVEQFKENSVESGGDGVRRVYRDDAALT